jgi:hypothetical protein
LAQLAAGVAPKQHPPQTVTISRGEFTYSSCVAAARRSRVRVREAEWA